MTSEIIKKALPYYYEMKRRSDCTKTQQLLNSDFIACGEGSENYKDYLTEFRNKKSMSLVDTGCWLVPIKLLQQIEQSTTLFKLTVGKVSRARVLMEKYKNLPVDMADASLVIAAEELQVADILSTDRRDFQAYRWKNHHPFKNLLLSDI